MEGVGMAFGYPPPSTTSAQRRNPKCVLGMGEGLKNFVIPDASYPRYTNHEAVNTIQRKFPKQQNPVSPTHT